MPLFLADIVWGDGAIRTVSGFSVYERRRAETSKRPKLNGKTASAWQLSRFTMMISSGIIFLPSVRVKQPNSVPTVQVAALDGGLVGEQVTIHIKGYPGDARAWSSRVAA